MEIMSNITIYIIIEVNDIKRTHWWSTIPVVLFDQENRPDENQKQLFYSPAHLLYYMLKV